MNQTAHPLAAATFVAFDTETTGFDARAGRVLEIAGVKFGFDGRILGAFQSLIDPGMPIPAEVIRVHGITDDEVRGRPNARVVLTDFFRFVGGPETVLVAHNAPFDLGFLREEILRHELDWPANPVLDTLTLARRYYPKLPNHKLETVARSVGLTIDLTHRAFPDSLLVRGILTEIFSRLPAAQAVAELTNSRLRLAPTAPIAPAVRPAPAAP